MKTINRLATMLAVLPAVAVLAGCPKDKTKDKPADTFKPDTTAVNLDTLKSDIGQAAPDTGKPPVLPTTPAGPTQSRIPPAPAALMEAVQREAAFTQFCYQEFGQKSDPSLRGGVTMVVTVGRAGISAARVGASNWSSGAGKSVNKCLEEKAADAWKLPSGAVSPGQYAVPLRFTSA